MPLKFPQIATLARSYITVSFVDAKYAILVNNARMLASMNNKSADLHEKNVYAITVRKNNRLLIN